MKITPENLADFARVPEHSPGLMSALSNGEAIIFGQYLFFAADNWLSAIAYPLYGKYDNAEFSRALDKAQDKTGAQACFAIGSFLPQKLQADIVERDRFYIVGADAAIPKKLKNPVAKAAEKLEVSETGTFTPGHRQLWAEFLQKSGASPMHARVRELYAKTPQAMRAENPDLRFLDARDKDGKLVACLLLDYGPRLFTSYILGAHSRRNYVPHAHDLLFAEMIARSRKAGKHFVNLGLGVNEGILRFKLKWGARPYYPYLMAQWTAKGRSAHQVAENIEARDNENVGHTLAMVLMRYQGNVSARQVLGEAPVRKPYAMLWKVEKGDKISWLGGTAHFFYYSFEPSFRRLFRNVDNVIFEGPLDAAFMAKVDEAGKSLPENMTPLIDLLSEDEIARLEKTIWGPQDKLSKFLGMAVKKKKDVRWLLRHARYWHAFFSLWTAFLERQGWKNSVDMEAWRVARDMGKNIIAMESLEEQIDSLGSLPVERVLNFFRACDQWKKRAKTNLHAYLAGDLELMFGSSAEFPTRTEYVIGRRDQRFRERMRPYLEEGRAAVFVGTAHLINLRKMLVEDGFSVRQQPFGILPRLRLGYRNISGKGDVKW